MRRLGRRKSSIPPPRPAASFDRPGSQGRIGAASRPAGWFPPGSAARRPGRPGHTGAQPRPGGYQLPHASVHSPGTQAESRTNVGRDTSRVEPDHPWRPGCRSHQPGAGRRAVERAHSQDPQVQRGGRRGLAAERQPLRGHLAASLHPGPDQRPRLPVATGKPVQRRAQCDPPAVRLRAPVLRRC